MEEPDYEVFHGTDREIARKIVKENKFIPGEDTDNEDFLGKGVYFFKEEEHAVLWNLKRARDRGNRYLKYEDYILEYAILQADIMIDKKNLLDLNHPKDITKYEKICRKFQREFEEDIEYKEALHKDRAIINYLFKKHYMDGIYAIRKFEGQKTKTSNINVGDYIQREVLCVKNNEIIKNIKIIKDIKKDLYEDIKYISI